MKQLLPRQAWALLQQGLQAAADGAGEPPLFVDVRMEIESLYVGRPPGVDNIPWYDYPVQTPDPQAFVAQVEQLAAGKHRTVLLLCRSGRRSLDAALALEAAGFGDVVHIVHGFEGDLDAARQRSRRNGWRFDGLPWEQM
jgi:rhodanese-related sulfurtransferase